MRLLIADDEVTIRQGLVHAVDWNNECGIDEVLTAKNGKEALEICKEKKPEIIITDIRMPMVDGLEFGRLVVKMYSPVAVILLSGYSEFDYAMQAIKIGVIDYLLKPVNIGELQEKVEQAILYIEDHLSHSAQVDAYDEICREKMFLDFFNKKQSSDEKRELIRTYLEVEKKQPLRIGIFSADEADNEQNGVIMNELKEYIKEVFESEGKFIFLYNGNAVFAFLNQESMSHDYAIRVRLKKVNQKAIDLFGVTISLAVGDIQTSATIEKSFANGKKALCHRMYMGENALIYWDNIIDVQEEKSLISLQPDLIEEYVEGLQYEMLEEYFQGIIEQLSSNHTIHEDIPKMICYQLKSILADILKNKGLDIHELVIQEDSFYASPNFVTLDGYLRWIYFLFGKSLRKFNEIMPALKNRDMIRAADYIARNYSDKNIDLQMVAEYVGITRNYFCSQFKKEMGVSFVDYLNKVRVEEAKKLLMSTDNKTYEISDIVGFSNYKYFSMIFKKITGKVPGQFRRQSR